MRENENGYPCSSTSLQLQRYSITKMCIFSQKTAQIVSDTFNVGDRIDSMLTDAQVIKTKNADNEVRFKLSTNPTSRLCF